MGERPNTQTVLGVKKMPNGGLFEDTVQAFK
jgi:hypothetical protein